jgi:hypothetical protein
MTIVNSLPYTIQNGQAVDAVPVMANFSQIVSNVNANAAPVAGNAAQTFAVAPATASSQAVNLGQFSAALSGNGYKKGPAGDIDQWVYAATGTTSAGSMMITLPIAFPSTFLSAVACSANGSNSPTAVGLGGGSTLTQAQVFFAANTSGVFVRAIGK